MPSVTTNRDPAHKNFPNGLDRCFCKLFVMLSHTKIPVIFVIFNPGTDPTPWYIRMNGCSFNAGMANV